MMTFLAVVLFPLGVLAIFIAMLSPFVVLMKMLDKDYKCALHTTLVMAVSYVLSYGYIGLLESIS